MSHQVAWQIITDGSEYPAASTFSIYVNVSQLKAVHILTHLYPDTNLFHKKVLVCIRDVRSQIKFSWFPHFIRVVLEVEPQKRPQHSLQIVPQFNTVFPFFKAIKIIKITTAFT